MNLEAIMLDEISQTEKNPAWCYSHVKSKEKHQTRRNREWKSGCQELGVVGNRERLEKGYKLQL